MAKRCCKNGVSDGVIVAHLFGCEQMLQSIVPKGNGSPGQSQDAAADQLVNDMPGGHGIAHAARAEIGANPLLPL